MRIQSIARRAVIAVLGCVLLVTTAARTTAQAPLAAPGRQSTAGSPGGSGKTYRVGPGQQFTHIGDVPWYSLGPGDTVYIHYQPSPYKEKFLIQGRGRADAWIRVIGVPDPVSGALPVISGDGATTGTTMHYRQADVGANGIQYLGVVQVAVGPDVDGVSPPLPGYIEIAGLRVQDAFSAYNFIGENGASGTYHDFASCVYIKSGQHVVVRDNILTNCGLGVFNWTGGGYDGGTHWWDGLSVDLTLRGNYFFNNGIKGAYGQHQSYTESDGVIIEYNRYGPMRDGTFGSQLKDRSVGTVVRYNYVEQSRAGWDMDLVDPEESYQTLGKSPKMKQTFVYGNIFFSPDPTSFTNIVHWNEDHNIGQGRATLSDGKLFFYNNTLVYKTSAEPYHNEVNGVFNETWGSYDCSPKPLGGTVDVRNNIFYIEGGHFKFGYCGQLKFNFVNNWITKGVIINGVSSSGTDTNTLGTGNPGFVDVAKGDFHLRPDAAVRGKGGPLAPEVTNNVLGLDLTPNQEYAYHSRVAPRATSGVGSDLGALTVPLQAVPR